MRFSACFIVPVLLFGSGCGTDLARPTPGNSTPVLETGVVRQALSDTSYPTRDDLEDGNVRWDGSAMEAYVGVAGVCNNKAPSRKRYMNVRFDLSNIPACATVTAVTLTFTHRGCKTCQSNDDVSIDRLTTNWSESGTAHTGAGPCSGAPTGAAPLDGSRAGNPTKITVVGRATGTATFQFTGGSASQLVKDVQAMLAGANYGWQLYSNAVGATAGSVDCSAGNPCSTTPAGCGASKKIISTVENGTVANRPKLVVTYTFDNARCNDGNSCTDNVCTASGCTYPADNSNTCTDGISCTTDACSNKICVSTAVNSACDDNNVCTTDTCSKTTGCGHANNANACNDGIACTQTDVCAAGKCGGTPNAALCDDGNPCTTDTCNALTGCVHTDNTVACADTASCTQNDKCGGGVCAGTPNNTLCDDGNACTTDTCNPSAVGADAKGCVYANAVGSCVDGVACTTGDSCSGSTCTGTPSNALCDDANDCTTDVCNATTGCSTTPRADGTACASDGNVCHKTTCQGGACHTPNPGVSCRAGSCSGTPPNAVAVAPAVCTAAGACPAITNTPCGAQPCNTNGSACQGSCATDADCTSTFFCNGTTCAAKRPQGGVCTRNAMCTNATCVDGVCCASACGGGNPNDCQACNASGVCTALSGTACQDANACTTKDTCSAGTCVGGAAPNCDDGNPCTVDGCNTGTGCTNAAGNAGASCRAAAGVCDAAELCSGSATACPVNAFKAAGSPCRAVSCTGGTQTAAAACTGSSAVCPASVITACAPYVCGATACLKTCTTNADCSASNFCSAGACIPQRAGGAPCGSDVECATGHCTDGVCCDQACAGQCEACDAQGSVGTCKPVTGTPMAPRLACAGDGSPCNGFCNGTSGAACTFPGSATACRSPSCTKDIATFGAACNGAGSCPALRTQPCTPYVCGPSQCEGSCTTDVQCQTGLFCSAGKCVPLLTGGNKCAHDSDCVTGICADGLCCDARCSGQCEACDVAGSEGKCSPVPNGAPRGARAPCVTDGKACGGFCDGTSRDSCVYPGQGVECRAASCTGGTATIAAYCEGIGMCPPEQRLDCGGACVGALCGNQCTSDQDCGLGKFCVAGLCRPKRANADACNDSSECASSYCVDGVCCDRACIGQCEACNAGGALGTCTSVVGAPRGVRASCAGTDPNCAGSCDGVTADRCTYPGASVVCTPPSCANGVATLPQTCNGGSCGPVQYQPCSPFMCGATECNGNCTSDANCAASEYCAAGVCVPRLLNGTPCAGVNQCANGFCVDGVCCDKACDHQCEACDDPTSVGACISVSGRPHGVRPACGGTAACEGRCDGSNAIACNYPTAPATCGQTVCLADTLHNAPTCNGAGTCIASAVDSCYPFACAADGVSCATSCAVQEDCAAGLVCTGTGCEVPLDAGRGGGGAGASEGGLPRDAGQGGATSTGGLGGNTGNGGRGGGVTKDAGPGASGSPSGGPDGGAHAKAKDQGGCGCRMATTGQRNGRSVGTLLFGILALRRRRPSAARGA